mgnify:CR=1 FL=1
MDTEDEEEREEEEDEGVEEVLEWEPEVGVEGVEVDQEAVVDVEVEEEEE